MSVHIGSFGTPRPAVEAHFDYFGTRIRVHPDASDLAFTEFLSIAKDIKVDENGQPIGAADNQRAAMLLDDTLRGQIHPDDLEEFMRIAKANRQNTMDLMVLSQGIVAAVAGFPTGPQSASSAGPNGDTQRLPGGSSSRADRRKEAKRQAKQDKKARRAAMAAPATVTPIGDATVARATKALTGRPDLQLMVMRRQEMQDASA